MALFIEELQRDLARRVLETVSASDCSARSQLAELRREIRKLDRLFPGRAPGPGPASGTACSIRGCGQGHVARGLCKNHYQQARYREKRALALLSGKRL
jgi:hypothetical protein